MTILIGSPTRAFSPKRLVRAAAFALALAGFTGAAFAHGPEGGHGPMMGPGMGYGWGPGGGMMGPGMGGGPGYGWGQGPGMMGPGMMGPGMMGYGMMGPGMMGPGMMGYGWGGGMAPWGAAGEGRELSVDDAKLLIERRLAMWGNPRLKVGAVKEEGAGTIIADVITVDNSLVERYQIDRRTGAMRSVRP